MSKVGWSSCEAMVAGRLGPVDSPRIRVADSGEVSTILGSLSTEHDGLMGCCSVECLEIGESGRGAEGLKFWRGMPDVTRSSLLSNEGRNDEASLSGSGT